MKVKRYLTIFAILILTIATVLILGSCNKDPEGNTPVEIARQGETKYSIVFTQNGSLSPRWANTLKETFFSEFEIEIESLADTSAEAEHEIVIGETNRPLSAELKAAVTQGKPEDSWLWGFGYKDGKLAIYANSQKAFNKALEQLKTDYFKDGAFTVPADLWVTYEYTKAQQDADAKAEADRIAAEKEAEKLAWQAERLEYVKSENAKFNTADFGVAPAILSATQYKDPERSLATEHPRVMVNASMIPVIKEALEKPENIAIKADFWALADDRTLTGIMPEVTHSTGEVYNYNTKILAIIEAKAFAYLLTENEVYGYEAIYAIKNAMMTYKYIKALHMDVYHGPSHLMIIAAEVYDWCYDLLTAEDKTQIINGVHKFLMEGKHFTNADFVLEENYPKSAEYPNGVTYGMELKYPPSAMNGVSGHGTGPQFLRDYMTVAVAFADERPDWWDFIGGRFYQEYLPVANHFMQNGWVSQGSTGYGDYKLYCYMWSAWLLKTATGNNPYIADAAKTGYFMLSNIMPNEKVYESGDGGRSGNGSSINYQWMFLLAGLYNDSTMLANAKYYTNNYTSSDTSAFSTMSRPIQLILVSNCEKADEDRRDNLDLINYFAYPAGQMTIRENWLSDCAGTYMKIGELTMANHDNMDSGTFQIYYKGLLACTSGAYKKYGSPAHYYYLQGTVGANGLLVYNPNLADSEPKYNSNGALTNGVRYWYSGGQYKRSEAGNINNWLNSGKYNMGKVTAYASGYKSDKTAKYGYIRGDITSAYDGSTVDYVGRSMLTVYTENEKFPMVFFVFDNVTSDFAEYKKTFLLHTVNEPTVDKDKLTATVVAGEGKLVLTNVTGGEKIEKIGGEGFAYWIGNENDFDGTSASGKNCTDDFATTDNFDRIWGRVEVIAEKQKTTNMLNVMYVTDSTTTDTLTVNKIEGSGIVGAVIDKVCAVFTTTEDPSTEALSFVPEGNGTLECYVSGLYPGKWKVSVDGGTAKTYTATKDSGMIRFGATAGKTVTVTPGDDILPSGTATINYRLDGGTLPADAMKYYTVGETTSLASVVPTRDDDVFLGWYTDAALKNRITEISADMNGTLTLYAAFKCTYISEDYSETVVDAKEESFDVTDKNMRYVGHTKPGSSFKTVKTDTDSYLVWVKGSSDSFFIGQNAANGFDRLSGDDISVSYEVSFGRNGTDPMIATAFRLQIASADGGGEAFIFTSDREGNVYYKGDAISGDDDNLITTVGDEPITLRFVVSFTNATVSFYDTEGNIFSVRKLVIPSNYDSVESFRAAMKSYYFYWYSGGNDNDTSLRIHGIRIIEGNIFE